jgi:TonB family protein
MLHVLLESGGRRVERRPGWTVASTIAHAALITGAIALTMRAPAAARTDSGPLVPPIYVPTPPADPATNREPDRGRPVVGPIEGPDIPPISLPSVPTFDPGRPWSRGLTGILDGKPALTAPDFGPGTATGSVHTPESVDRVVMPLPGNPRPDYPPTLRAAGLEGEVLVTFVVDSTGRVEPGSITVRRESHAQFAESVRRWLPRTRYQPAELRGRPVRQLVQQQVGFSLAR